MPFAVPDWLCMVGLTFWVPAGIDTLVIIACCTRVNEGPIDKATSTLSVTGTNPTSSTYTLRSLRSAGVSGIVTAAEMRYWLSRDADYVVIDTTFLEGELPHFGETEKEMMVLIERHFEVVGRVTDAPGCVHTVYKRRGR